MVAVTAHKSTCLNTIQLLDAYWIKISGRISLSSALQSAVSLVNTLQVPLSWSHLSLEKCKLESIIVPKHGDFYAQNCLLNRIGLQRMIV